LEDARASELGLNTKSKRNNEKVLKEESMKGTHMEERERESWRYI